MNIDDIYQKYEEAIIDCDYELADKYQVMIDNFEKASHKGDDDKNLSRLWEHDTWLTT